MEKRRLPGPARKAMPGRSASLPSSALTRKASSGDLLAKEEEYKRLNAELEAKTAELVRQAEEVMKGQEEMLSQPVSHIGIFAIVDDEKIREVVSSDGASFENKITKNKNKVGLKNIQGSRPSSAKKGRKLTSAKHKTIELHAADDVAVPEDFSNFSLEKTINKIEGQLEDGFSADVENEVMPSIGNEMGTEAQIRFLKAKLRVMQEELDRLAHEYNKKDDENDSLNNRVKEIEEECNKLKKTTSIQQTQIEKYKNLADEAYRKSDGLQQQVTSLQKDTTNQEKLTIDQLKTENKKLEKQKTELMTGFKKQLKLIDILKRQKMHMEAAKMLSFTEEEFIKALEWGN
ncbi:hypothetical protein scyTo_0010386 [Scyliorhinus torazame]|uniref:Testis-expressed sequence 9 protein n=1 Tax=Scyliorhinus torazame TaxID=75743 RepID=A0A401P5C4_SCYTO|nr:hypothetical protein [Scyliorhinus torazame]